ncbi:MAG: hypothetical protein ACTS2F_23655 [Thainema sp.]
MYKRENHLDQLDLDYEHDAAYEDSAISSAIANDIAQMKLVLCGNSSKGPLEDCSYLSIDPTYAGALSIGQRQLYEILLTLQEASIYTVTTVGKLAQMMDLQVPMACGKRLENLQSLGAIAGFNGD